MMFVSQNAVKQINRKYRNIDINKKTHSEMGPVRQNPVQRHKKLLGLYFFNLAMQRYASTVWVLVRQIYSSVGLSVCHTREPCRAVSSNVCHRPTVHITPFQISWRNSDGITFAGVWNFKG